MCRQKVRGARRGKGAKGQKKSGLLTKLLQNLRKGAKMTKITKMVEAACQTIMKNTNLTYLTH